MNNKLPLSDKIRRDCARRESSHLEEFFYNDFYKTKSPKELVFKGLQQLIKLREDGILDESQFMTVLKYLISSFVENQVIEKVDTALEKSIFSRSLS